MSADTGLFRLTVADADYFEDGKEETFFTTFDKAREALVNKIGEEEVSKAEEKVINEKRSLTLNKVNEDHQYMFYTIEELELN